MDEIYYDDIVISSRIRLARNLTNYVFPNKLKDENIANEIIVKIFDVLSDFENYKVGSLDETILNSLQEKHLISDKLVENKQYGALSLSHDEEISVMINEEEHIREQCILKGFKLNEALNKLNEIDDKLIDNLDIAYDKKLGFITTCPSNLGTGLRASVMLFLPALTITNSLEKLFENLNSVGLTVRGNYGENSDSNGFVYQISNSQTLGLSEQEIIDNVSEAIKKICEKEQEARDLILDTKYADLFDSVNRSYGTLKYAYKISSTEATKLLSQLKFGICLNLISCATIEKIDSLIEDIQTFTLQNIAGQKFSELERDIFRAKYIKERI